MTNDITLRDQLWRRLQGDEWESFDALPAPVRKRLQEHAYDAWAVNALALWRHFRRQLASTERATRRLLRYLDECEARERADFDAAYRARHGRPLPHVAAAATTLRVAATKKGRP
ncbi:DUF6525 family protein [Roseomonas sp. GC11]|uniref:DUF6525 family protein n=1 Tax=Roseomonas sp. GC11 TaxID=2950546 RepID=UPI00210E260C|nr:DUF6525 family protein [Roseomonas sp. GC11]MCQ4158708.1 DUF6525 family protein [Roseomonas sp. GC11]